MSKFLASLCLVLTITLTACSYNMEKNISSKSTNTVKSEQNASPIVNSYKSIESNKKSNKHSEDVVLVSYGEKSYVSDPRVPQNLIDQSVAAIKVNILKKKDASFLGGSNSLFTKYSVNVTEVLNGKYTLGEHEIYMEGGLISVGKFKKLKPDNFRKLELYTVPENELEKKFISFDSEDNYELEEGQQYVLLISDTDIVMCSGYGTFKPVIGENRSAETSGYSEFKNVLTGKALPKMSK